MLSDAKARKLKPTDKPVSDGTITGLYLMPGGSPGSGKWILRFLSPTTGKVNNPEFRRHPRVTFSAAFRTRRATASRS